MDWTQVSNTLMGSIKNSVVGEDILYRKVDTQDFIPMRGIFSHQYIGIDDDTGAAYVEQQPSLSVHDSDILNKPQTGDECIVRGVQYRVDGMHVDGHLTSTTLQLKRMT